LIPVVERQDLISAYSAAILGTKLGVVAGIIVFIACLNSACALSIVFARYLAGISQRVGIDYKHALIACTIFSFGFSNFGFAGIDNAISPITQLVYPVLILISIFGAINAMWSKHSHIIIAK
jgi:LIVCS family branched-chain amino acid:cation transporter